MSHHDPSHATTLLRPSSRALRALVLCLFAVPIVAQYTPLSAPDGGLWLPIDRYPGLLPPFIASHVYPPECQTLAFGNKAWAGVTLESKYLTPPLLGYQPLNGTRTIVKLDLKDASHGLLDVDLGAVKLQGSSGLKWYVQVQSQSLPAGQIVRADLTGAAVLDGRLWVYGSGSATVSANLSVSEILAPSQVVASRTRIVAATSFAEYEIRHAYAYGLGASIDLAAGDGAEVPLSLSASRGFSFETRRLRKERVEFSIPVLLQVGSSYVIEFALRGTAENRGLRALHRSGIQFGKAALGGTGDALEDTEAGPTDPSHLVDAMDFFALDLPDLNIGKSFKGGAQFKFPALAGVFDGKLIDVDNEFSIAPLGEFDRVSEIFDKLGWSPLSLREKLSKPSGPLDQFASTAVGGVEETEGGVWFESLELRFD